MFGKLHLLRWSAFEPWNSFGSETPLPFFGMLSPIGNLLRQRSKINIDYVKPPLSHLPGLLRILKAKNMIILVTAGRGCAVPPMPHPVDFGGMSLQITHWIGKLRNPKCRHFCEVFLLYIYLKWLKNFIHEGFWWQMHPTKMSGKAHFNEKSPQNWCGLLAYSNNNHLFSGGFWNCFLEPLNL